MEQITISGKPFNVPVRYEEGHELTAGEASALNQTYHENLRNNFAKKVKDAGDTAAPDVLAKLQAELDTYASEYQFGVRTPGTGITRDPVMSEAMRIAKSQLAGLLKKEGKGRKISDFETGVIHQKCREMLDKDPQIMELAKQRVAEQQSMASADIGDLLSGLTEKPAAPATAEPTAQTEQPAPAPVEQAAQ